MFLSFIGQLDTKRKMTKNLKPLKQIISISDVTIFEGDIDDIHIGVKIGDMGVRERSKLKFKTQNVCKN